MDEIKKLILDRLRGEYEWRHPLEYTLTASHGERVKTAIDELISDGVLVEYTLHHFAALRVAGED